MTVPTIVSSHAVPVARATEYSESKPEAQLTRLDGLLAEADEISANVNSIWAAPPRQLPPARLTDRMAVVDFAVVIMLSAISKITYIDLYLAQDTPLLSYLMLGALLAVILHFFYKQFGLYELGVLRDPSLRIGKLWAGLSMSFLVLLGLLFLFKIGDEYSRGWLLSWFALSALALPIARAMTLKIVAGLVADGKVRTRAAVFGSSELVPQLAERLRANCPEVQVVGCYCDEADFGRHNATSREVDGGLQKLLAAANDERFEQIILVFHPNDHERIREAVNRLAIVPAELCLCTDLSLDRIRIGGSRNFGGVRIDVVMSRPATEGLKSAKAGLDVTLAVTALLLLSPVLLLAALAIKIDSGGPVLFRQRRFGYNNRLFRIYKFRTMVVAEDGLNVKQAQLGDRRVTRVGAFLRRTSIDELPQLLNVLKGEMSIVGPRPHALVHNELFARQLENYPCRHRVKPGITGWAQIHGFRGETKTAEDLQKRIDHDLYYIDNWSFWLDLEIIIRTGFALISGRRAY